MLWIKAFHIVSVVCWFAALFYLPRLFVYHTQSEDLVSRERFQTMERKLYRGIATPSMIATLVFGVLLAANNWTYYSGAIWFWVKIALISVLLGYHHLCARYIRLLKEEKNPHSHLFFRWFNEFPVLILITVVILVVVKPF